ncbi:MAG: adenine phosphoribosyltransferase [Gemmatimonadaceae bacterium]|nr:adenine phosphoribosyltransferase [Gemmatimonadaceae bacterium]
MITRPLPEGRETLARDVRAAIRDVPDFPKPGIIFKDITPVLSDAALFARVTDSMAAGAAALNISHVVAVESRGFIFAAPVAQALRRPMIPVRKPGKLPHRLVREEYALEYGTDALEMHEDALGVGARVLVVDDVLATGGTAAATRRLVERAGGIVVAFSFLIDLTFLHGRQSLAGSSVDVIVEY